MVQIALVVVSVLLVVLGIRGFSASGLALTRNIKLTGRKGKIVGVLCIVLGVGLIPLFLLLVFLYTNWLSG